MPAVRAMKVNKTRRRFLARHSSTDKVNCRAVFFAPSSGPLITRVRSDLDLQRGGCHWPFRSLPGVVGLVVVHCGRLPCSSPFGGLAVLTLRAVRLTVDFSGIQVVSGSTSTPLRPCGHLDAYLCACGASQPLPTFKEQCQYHPDSHTQSEAQAVVEINLQLFFAPMKPA